MGVVDGNEARLFLFASIGSLLDFHDVGVFEHLKAVAAGGKEHYVAGEELSRAAIVPVGAVQVEPRMAGPDEQNLLGRINFSMHRIMNVCIDDVPLRPTQHTELLDTLVAGHEFDSRILVPG